MRIALVTLGTALSTLAVVGNAFFQKKQFYPSVVYITKSNPSMAVLYAQVFVFVFLFGKALRKVFFGQLRPAEIEHLIEKFWYVITETCLAFTVFRDDFSPKFVALFTFLLFMKAFHWLVEDRVDYMERSPIITFKFHIRAVSLLGILGTVDSVLIHHAFQTTLASGASVQMVFGFEYAILLTMVVAILVKYILHAIDMQTENPWENKTVYLLYNELVTGFIKCILYVAFVGVMVKIHTFPLFAIRPMYLAVKTFKKSLSDVILSRRAISYMNTRFPDATQEELSQLDNTCIICREEMLVGKKLPCNHIFHVHCLRSWFQRQQSCPTCRMDVLSQTAAQAQAAQAPAPAPPAAVQQPGGAVPPMQPPPPFGMMPAFPPPGLGEHFPASSTETTATSSSQIPESPFLTGQVPPLLRADSMGYLPQPRMPPGFSGVPMPPMSPFGMPSMPPFMGQQFQSFPFSPQNMNLDELSKEQLEHMEGQEKENIKCRLEVLKNIHSLLDAAIIQLKQYASVISTLNNGSVPDGSVPPTGNINSAGNSFPTNIIPKGQTIEQISSTDEIPENHVPSTEEIAASDDNEVVRRRRLDRFESRSEVKEEANANSQDN